MLRQFDYQRIQTTISFVKSLKRENFDYALFEGVKGQKLNCDFKNQTIEAPLLYSWLAKTPDSYKLYLATEKNWIFLDFFLLLYSHVFRNDDLDSVSSYKEILRQIEFDRLYLAYPELHELQNFFTLSYQLVIRDTSWPEFTEGFNPKNWSDILLLINILPLSRAGVSEFLLWMEKIVNAQQKDLALGSLSSSITSWVTYGKGVEYLSDDEIKLIAQSPGVNRFLFAVLKGVKDRCQHKTIYYIRILEPEMQSNSHFSILNAIGFISSENEKDEFLQLLIDRFENHQLPTHEFIRLAGNFNLFESEVYKRIDPLLADSENILVFQAIIEYLQQAPDTIDQTWFKRVADFAISLPHAELVQPLDLMLFQLADNNELALCYELLNIRIENLGRDAILETGITQMINSDTVLFYQNLVSWIIHENPVYHQFVFSITSRSNFDQNLFSISPIYFENLSPKDKIYAAYKIVGYIYSMEILQRILVSLIRSVNEEHEQVREAFEFVLKEYLIYNYRSTLDILRKNLADDQLPVFARSLFQECISYFEDYFKQLRSISIKKEISPYKVQSQLYSFYYQKLFADIPKKAHKKSIVSLFKQTDVNANNWAVRRPDEFKHNPQSLGRISVSSEFPSGEKLNPINQEYIRKTYQNLTKDEISID